MREIVRKHIQGKKVLVIFTITNLVYLTMLLITIPQVLQYSSGMNLFDMMPGGYSVEYAQTLLQTLGEAGRSIYMTRQLPLDMIYPSLFGLTYSLIIAYFLNKIFWFERPVFFVTLLPIVAGLFDYAENIGIYTLLSTYPDFSPVMAVCTNTFTIIKSVVSTLSFMVLLILLSIFLVRKMTATQTESK